MFTVGKEFKFDAAHFLPGHRKCGQVHGHTYHVTVAITGHINQKKHMLIDLHDLKTIVQPVIDSLDHKNLNDILDVTTCEEIAYFIWKKTEPKIRKVLNTGRQKEYYVIYVKVQEGDGGYAIYEG